MYFTCVTRKVFPEKMFFMLLTVLGKYAKETFYIL